LGAEHVVPGHLGRIDRNGEQADTLFRRQQGAMGHDEGNCRMTRTYEIKPRGSNLGFDLKLYEDGVEMGGGIFPAHERTTEAEAFDDAMAEAEAWVAFGRDYRTQSERERSGS
jgi:hypothetical protein